MRTWIVDPLAIFLLASILIWPIYRVEYTEAWASIESTFIADARFLSEHWPNPVWQPNWYCGTRFDYIYPPALRYGTAAISRWFDVSTARGYHLYTAFLYSLGIAGVYVFTRTVARSRGWAIWTAAAAAIVSPSLLFLAHFREGYKPFYYMPVRLGVLVQYGEGPHMSAFALLPFALAFAWHGLRRGKTAHLAGAAFLSALVVSNNFYGATALAILFPVLVWSVWLAEQDKLVWLRAVAVAGLAWQLTAFWLTPSYLRITLRNMKLVSHPGNAWSVALALVVALVYCVVSYRFARGKPERAWPAFAAGAFALMGLNVLGHYYTGFRVMGEPERLVPELDLVLIFAAAAVFAWLCTLGRWWRIAAVVLALAALIPAKGYVRRAWRLLPQPSDHRERVEFHLTEWMHRNLPEVRTMSTGSVRFWYNAWRDLPQLGGGSEQGLINLNTNVAYSHVTAHETADLPVMWLQAMGTEAVIVHDATSKEIYHDYVKPEKLDGAIPKIFDDGAGNRIYRVPRRYPHLGRIVELKRIRSIEVPETELAWPDLTAYVDAVERGPDASIEFRREDLRRVRIKTRLRTGEAILVQETFDPAWRAYSNGHRVPIIADAIGFQILNPGPGEHDILLQFETPLENKLGGVAFGFATLAMAWLVWRQFHRRDP